MSHTATFKAGHKLSSKQLQAAAIIATGKTQDQAAKELNVSRITVVRWCRREEMQAAIKDAEDRLADTHLRLLYKLIGKAVKTLNREMDSPRGTVAVMAASKVLDLVIDLGKLSVIEKQLKELEQQSLVGRENSLVITPLQQGEELA